MNLSDFFLENGRQTANDLTAVLMWNVIDDAYARNTLSTPKSLLSWRVPLISQETYSQIALSLQENTTDVYGNMNIEGVRIYTSQKFPKSVVTIIQPPRGEYRIQMAGSDLCEMIKWSHEMGLPVYCLNADTSDVIEEKEQKR